MKSIILANSFPPQPHNEAFATHKMLWVEAQGSSLGCPLLFGGA